MFNTSLWKAIDIPGTMSHHTANEPRQIMNAYFRPMMYPKPNTAAQVFTLNTSLALSAAITPQSITRVVKFSFHQPTVATMKSYNPPTRPATSNGLACEPPFSPLTRTCVVAVASGKGYLPCMSLTKYLRNGIINRIPSIPPNSEEKNTLKNETLISGYFACRI